MSSSSSVGLLAAYAAASLLALAAAESLSFSRVHIVDHDATTGNFLFRSNMPVATNSSSGQNYFPLSTLVSYMEERAAQANLTFPSSGFFLDIRSLNNQFETDYQFEEAWAKANPTLGSFTLWTVLGQLVSPSEVNATEFNYYTHNNTALWGIDQLPTRVPDLRTTLTTKFDQPRVILFHCEAGCDRTGEMASSYYIQEVGLSAQQSYNRSTVECGRAPDVWSTNAIEWYCETLTVQGIAKPGNCTV